MRALIKYENKIINTLLQQLYKQYVINKIIFDLKQNIYQKKFFINLKKKSKEVKIKILKKISLNCKCA